jgi:hypothetical protein
MNDDRLRLLLRETPVPGAGEAECRGLRVVSRAYDERRPAPRPLLPRLALALAAAALLAAVVLSPAGAAVRDWIGDVFAAGVPNAEPALTDVPGGGRLLVNSPQGPWVVQPDGSRRLLGRYSDASWSPHGLFVAAAARDTLSAVEPDGTPRWSISAKGRVSDPRWSPSGFRIAYRAGHALRVVAADGTGDHRIARSTAVAPAWSPLGQPQLAYVDGRGQVRIAASESGRGLGTAKSLPGIVKLQWGEGGTVLLEASRRAVQVRPLRAGTPAQGIGFGRPRWLALPVRATVRDAAFSPRGTTVAVLLAERWHGGARSMVWLFGRNGTHQLLTVPGRLSELAFSPNGERLLVAWPEADQWLFLPAGRGEGRAIGGISEAFSPGTDAAGFPRVAGWCCAAVRRPEG